MLSLVSFVHATAYQATPGINRLPIPIWQLLTGVNKIHAIWRWYRRIELYKKPEKFFELLAGHVIHFIAGDLLIVRIAAQSLLVATRLLECSKQQQALCQAGKKWLAAFALTPVTPLLVSLPKRKRVCLISPSTHFYLKQKARLLVSRIQQIAHRTLKLFLKSFRLSMAMLDAVDALCLNPHTRNDATYESVVNLVKWLEAIALNEKELLNGLLAHKQIIEKLLARGGVSFEQFFTTLSNTLRGAKIVHKKAQAVSLLSREKLLQIGERVTRGSLVVIGVRI